MTADRVTLRRPCEHGLLDSHETQHCWDRERKEGVHESDDRCWCPGGTDIVFEQVWWCEVEGLGWDSRSEPRCVLRLPEEHSFHEKCGPRLMEVTDE